MYHKENPRIWVSGSDEPTPYCDDSTNKMGEGEEGLEQCLLLVLNDLGSEHDLFSVCSMLDLYIT
jgi:hypothetical protein